MKQLLLPLLLLILLVCSGCAYNQITITADNSSTVTCTGTVDKPTAVNPNLQGNVPIQGGTVTNPAQTQVLPKQ